MARGKIPVDWEQLSHAPLVENLSKQFTAYEKKVRTLVSDLDGKTRDARKKGSESLERFAQQLKERRSQIEGQITTMIEREGKKLSKNWKELVDSVRVATATSTPVSAKAPSKAKSASKSAAAPSGAKAKKAKSPSAKPRAKKASAQTSAPAPA